MSGLANELLNGLSEDDIVTYGAGNEAEGHIVVGADRFITVPENLKRIAVQFDHNVETVTFDCPRYWDGIDMSQMTVYINYKCPDQTLGAYLVEGVTIDEADDTIMHFDWAINRNLTKTKGNIRFLVCIKKLNVEGEEENHWNSEINSDLCISEGLECVGAVADKYPDLITQLLVRMDSSEAAVKGGAGIMSIEQTFISDEPNGENTIKVTLTDGREPIYFTVRNGLTPTRGVDYWTHEDKLEIINSVLAELPRAEGISV